MFITSLRHHFLSRRHLRVCKLATEPQIWSASRVFMNHGFRHSPELPKCSSSPQFSTETRGACAFGKLPLTLSTPNEFCLIMTIRICVLAHFLLKAFLQGATNVSPSNLFHCSTGCLIKNFFLYHLPLMFLFSFHVKAQCLYMYTALNYAGGQKVKLAGPCFNVLFSGS